MSLPDYADGLVKIAMGWLGWDLDKAMRSDCLAIQIGYEGRSDMLAAIFGGEKKPEELPAFGPGMMGKRGAA
ncbi:hypothetical protein ABMA46_10205 [Mesorhizobium sp. CN5-321]|uniref:hypothetical protein n=1 Tax=Mesorhizobium hunchu TaxID=3157708 RepID=UPI0032B7C037